MARREHTVGARLRLGGAAAANADGNGHANAAARPTGAIGRGCTRRRSC